MCVYNLIHIPTRSSMLLFIYIIKYGKKLFQHILINKHCNPCLNLVTRITMCLNHVTIVT